MPAAGQPATTDGGDLSETLPADSCRSRPRPDAAMMPPEGAPRSGRGDGARGRSSRGRGRGGGSGSGSGSGSGNVKSTSNRGGGGGGRRRRRGAGAAAARDGSSEGSGQPLSAAARDVAAAAAQGPAREAGDEAGDEAGEADDVCFICANSVAHHSIAPCNHATCHICGLRMRALYKTKDCAHCRTPAPFVIFTDDADKRFDDYADGDITTTDSNIGIKYTNEDIVGDTVLLLRYNCPDAACDFAGLGWTDLHRHVRSVHRKRMCDLCTRNKKVFTHEHDLFDPGDLERHMRHGDDKPGAADQTGFKGHPLCAFCGERFYDDNKLYEHCRIKHERCFICDRRDSRSPHYYRDYDALERHFKDDHYLCANGECLDKKFVVFESELDLQAHQLSEHAGKTAGRDARLVDMSAFDIRQSYQHERRRGGRGAGRGRGGRRGGRGRDPSADVAAPTPAQPLRRDELAFQRQMAIHSAQSVSTRTFGGQLTASAPSSATRRAAADSPTTPNAGQSGAAGQSGTAGQSSVSGRMEALSVADASSLAPEQRARLVRHSAVVERAANLLANDGAKLAAFRDHVSAYRAGSLAAPQLIDALFTLFADVSSNALGTLVREVADLFDDAAKADALRTTWHDWRAINEDYPSLPGLSGMHGATSSSSGWATAAAASPAVPHAEPSQKHSTRVLKLKNSTRLGAPAPAAPPRPPGWVAPPAVRQPPLSAAAAFPSLPSAAAAAGPAPRPSWVGSAPQPPQRPAPPAAEDAFPALPAAPKPTTTIFGYGSGRGVRRDFGRADSGFRWGAGPAAQEQEQEQERAGEGEESSGAGRGKRGGKKGKRVLVQWG